MKYLLLSEDCASDLDGVEVRSEPSETVSWDEFYSKQQFHYFSSVSTFIKNLQSVGYQYANDFAVLPVYSFLLLLFINLV